MEDIVGPAIDGLKETLGASLEKLWKQRLEELERREQVVEDRERQLVTYEQKLREREQELTRREAAASASAPKPATPWPTMTLPTESSQSAKSLVPPTPDFGGAVSQHVENARPTNAEQKTSPSSLFPAKPASPEQKEPPQASKPQPSSLFPARPSSTEQKEPPKQEPSKPPASSLFPPKTAAPGLFATESTSQPTSNTGTASALFPSPAKAASKAAASAGLFPPAALSSAVPEESSTVANSSKSLFPGASNQPPSNRSLFPAATNQPSSNQTSGGKSLFPTANVQAPREEATGVVTLKSPPANVQTPPVAPSSPAVDTSDVGSASQLKNVFEQKVQSLKKSTEVERRRSWTPRHHELDLPDGQGKASFRAHDAPYQARTSFGAPVREKRSLSDLLDEDKRRTESFS